MESYNMLDRTLEEGEIEEEIAEEFNGKVDQDVRPHSVQNREWPLTFLHFKAEETLPAPPAATYPTPRCKTIEIVREPREQLRPRFARYPRYRKRHSIERNNKNAKDQLSYDDLLSQYRDIQSKLEELKQEEDSARNEKDGKENVKSTRRSTSSRRNSSRSGTRHARSRSKSVANESVKSAKAKSPPELRNDDDDEVQELRRLALASAKEKAKTKKSPERRTSHSKSSDSQLSSDVAEPTKDVKTQEIIQPHLFDNYDQVEMELDSNSSADEDEELLRSTLLMSMKQKTTNNHTIPVEKSLPVPPKIKSQEKTKTTLPGLVKWQPPLHKPVVINLSKDSSDSEMELETEPVNNKPSVLKVTNESDVLKVGTVTIHNRNNTKLVNDAKSMKHLKLISWVKKDEQDLTLYKSMLTKKRALLLEAERKVKRLTEELAATQKIVMANKASIAKISNQIKVTQARATERRAQLKKVFSSRTKILTNKPQAGLRNQTSHQELLKKPRSQQISEEKKRLLKREQEIAAQLRLLQKQNKINRGTTRQVILPGVSPPANPQPKNHLIAQNDVSEVNSPLNKVTANTQPQEAKYISHITMATPHNLDLFAMPWPEKMDVPLYLAKDNHVNLSTSPLTHLKAYRFSESFDGKFTSSTHANNINPDWILCSFDLLGICNDDQCPWQHSKHYTLKPEEILVEIASYSPSISGVDPIREPEKFQNKMNEYAKSLLKNESNLEGACLKLVQEIREKSGMILDRRKWVPMTMNGKPAKDSNVIGKETCGDTDSTDFEDDEEQRYFTRKAGNSEELEEILKREPNNVDIWMQLAETHSKNRCKSMKKTLDRTLHVLSRALESNRSSQILWLKYLIMYEQHPANEDFSELCRQAFEFAPSYEIGELYLKSSTEKLEVCEQLWRYLEIDYNADAKELNSIRALQLLLRQTQLNVANNQHNGINFLQGYLKENPSPLLLPHHLAFAWLILIHLTAFSSLPFNLFTGYLTLSFDESFIISWNTLPSPKKLIPLIEEAILTSERWNSPKSQFVLYWNLVELYLQCENFELAETACRKAMQKFPALIDAVVLYLKVVDNCSDKTRLLSSTREVVEKFESSCRLKFVAALIFMKNELPADSLSILCAMAKGLCGQTMLEPSCCYKNVLNLSQNLVIGKTVQRIIQSDELVYVWLAFSLYLHLDGQDATLTLDTALTRITCQYQRLLIWSFYLRLKMRPTLWLQLVRRCLNSIDIMSQMDLIDNLSSALKEDNKSNFLDTLHSRLPNNSHILLRYLEHLTAKGDDSTVTFIAREADVAAMSVEAALL